MNSNKTLGKGSNFPARRRAVCIIMALMISAAMTACEAQSSTADESPAVSSSVSETAVTESSAALDSNEAPNAQANALSLWTDNAVAKKKLTEYMSAVTDENSADFIPVENRIAVFDLDGTLFCETDPNYFDYTMLLYRVTEDPDYKDKASDFEKEVAAKIQTINDGGKAAEGLEVDHGKAVASAFSGMTQEEFNDYIQELKSRICRAMTA